MVFIEFIFFLFFFNFLNTRRAYLLNALEWFVLLSESFLFLVGFLWQILAMCLPLQFGFVLRLLRPSSYLGDTILSCTYIPYYVYLPDRLSTLTGLISDLAAI